jgi:dephospho-CoA kinase
MSILRVGLTGGYASGKTFVGRALSDLGCYLIQADQLGHQVINAEARDAIVAQFGTVDRHKLAALVFPHPDQLAKLSALVHPHVRTRGRQLEAAFAAREPDGIAVTEAAILVETGSYRDYDRLIVASCTPEQQLERAMLRDHLTREEVQNRLSRQMPLEQKVKYAHYVIDTSETKEYTLDQTRRVYASLRQQTR